MTYRNRWLSSRIHAPMPFAFTAILGTFEGVDIASVGLAMSRMTNDLGLDAAQGGYCASASMLGLTVGAAFGGRLADIFGRRLMMFVSIMLLGLFSIASAHAWDFQSMFIARFCTGLGLGGLMPILIALAGASAQPHFRSTAISILMASGGIGSALAAIVSLHPDWRTVFYFGGAGPVILIPLMLAFLPAAATDCDISRHEGASRISLSEALFGSGRLPGTLLAWSLAFLISLVSYIMINWLPTLLIQTGATAAQSNLAMMLYSVGVIVGNIVSGAIVDRGSPRAAYLIGYLGASACIAGLALGVAGAALYPLAGATAFFIFGAQLVTFSLTPMLYPAVVRATGIGAMVAAGRSGSVIGPLMVGLLLHSGLSASAVLLGLIPICLLSPMLGIALVRSLSVTERQI
ncbi:MAG: MFS transporter [Rhodobiaceae bacterium]|nr:MFS transporter [Rhodobiaceae bacterium]